jgi:hypothetical protein
MDETRMEPGTGTGVTTEEDTRTDYGIDEGDHDRFAHYVDKSKPLSAQIVRGRGGIEVGRLRVPHPPEWGPSVCP